MKKGLRPPSKEGAQGTVEKGSEPMEHGAEGREVKGGGRQR